MFNTRLSLFDSIHHKVVEGTCRGCDSNVVLLWNGPEVSEAALYKALGTCTSMANWTYMESADATGALQLGETIQHSILGRAGSLRSPCLLYFLSAGGCLLSALLELLLGVLGMTSERSSPWNDLRTYLGTLFQLVEFPVHSSFPLA